MTLKEKFNSCTNWKDKATVVEIYHSTQKLVAGKDWTLEKTGNYFGIMESTVSEYLKLGRALHDDENLFKKYPSKEKALISLGYSRAMKENRRRHDGKLTL